MNANEYRIGPSPEETIARLLREVAEKLESGTVRLASIRNQRWFEHDEHPDCVHVRFELWMNHNLTRPKEPG